MCGEIIEEIADARCLGPEEIRPLGERHADPAQQGDPLGKARQRVLARDLEACGHDVITEGDKGRGIAAQGLARARGEGTCEEKPEARDSEPLGTREECLALGFAIAPALARPGVEQHARHREIDAAARHLRARSSRQAPCGLLPALDPARREVAPAAMVGDCEGGIGRPDGLGDVGGDRIEAFRLEGEMLECLGLGRGEDHGRTRANGSRRAQPGEGRADVG